MNALFDGVMGVVTEYAELHKQVRGACIARANELRAASNEALKRRQYGEAAASLRECIQMIEAVKRDVKDADRILKIMKAALRAMESMQAGTTKTAASPGGWEYIAVAGAGAVKTPRPREQPPDRKLLTADVLALILVSIFAGARARARAVAVLCHGRGVD